MKLYKAPDGQIRRYADDAVPAGAVLLKPEIETKAVEEPANKAVTPKNKAVRGAKKK